MSPLSLDLPCLEPDDAMGFLSALKSRFFSPELCRVAKRGDVEATASCIARTSLVVIGAELGNSVPFDADENFVMAVLEVASRKKSFDGRIHKYEIDGETFVPLFTDSASAEAFCGAYCSLLDQVHAFRLFRVPGEYVRNWIADQDIIVINPQSGNEVEIDRSKSQLIRERLPIANAFKEAQFVSLVLPLVGISRPIELKPGA